MENMEEEDYGNTSNDDSTVQQKKDKQYVNYEKIITGEEELPKEAPMLPYYHQPI